MKKKFCIRTLFASILIAACAFAFVGCNDKETVPDAPVVTNVALTVAEGQTRGLVGVTHTLRYSVSNEASVVVTAVRNGVAATSDDFSYSAETQGVVFKTSGSFLLFVTATNGGGMHAASVGITAYTQDQLTPAVEVGFDKITVNTPMPLYSVHYAKADVKGTEEIAVEYREDGGEYAAATEEDYSFADGLFTAKKSAGSYKVTVTATGASGIAGTATREITARATPETVALSPAAGTDGWNRVAIATPTVLPYILVGDAAEYVVTVQGDYGLTGTATEAGLTVVAPDVGAYTATVVYAHRSGDAQYTRTLSYAVQAVDSLAYSPVFPNNPDGTPGDPFAQTSDEVIPSTGLLLYYDVRQPDGETKLTAANMQYALYDRDVRKSEYDTVLPVVGYVGGNIEYPFVQVPDYNSNNVYGSFTVKMTATFNGYRAAAFKTFTLTECKGGFKYIEDGDHKGRQYEDGETQEFDALQAYFEKVCTATTSLKMTGDENCSLEARENMIFTKNGVIAQRSALWQMHAYVKKNKLQEVNPAHMGYVNCDSLNSSGLTNCQLDFSLTPVNGSIFLRLGVRNHNSNNGGWAGFLDIKEQNGYLAVAAGDNNFADFTGPAAGQELPDMAQKGKKTYVRILRTGTNSSATLKVQFSADGENYYDVFEKSYGSSAFMRYALKGIQFDHGFGCFAIEDVVLTNTAA